MSAIRTLSRLEGVVGRAQPGRVGTNLNFFSADLSWLLLTLKAYYDQIAQLKLKIAAFPVDQVGCQERWLLIF